MFGCDARTAIAHTPTIYRIVFSVVRAKRIFQKNIFAAGRPASAERRAQHDCLIQSHVPCTAVVVRCHELLINFQNIQSHVIEMHIRARQHHHCHTAAHNIIYIENGIVNVERSLASSACRVGYDFH